MGQTDFELTIQVLGLLACTTIPGYPMVNMLGRFQPLQFEALISTDCPDGSRTWQERLALGSYDVVSALCKSLVRVGV